MPRDECYCATCKGEVSIVQTLGKTQIGIVNARIGIVNT